MSNRPQWANDIVHGDFAQAERNLGNALLPVVANAFNSEVVNQHGQRIEQQAGALAKYCKLPAMEAVQRDVQDGKVKTPQDLVNRYEFHMNEEVSRFKHELRPQRETITINGGQLTTYQPSDEEVRDYVSERRASQQQMKDEGKQIAYVGPHSPSLADQLRRR